MPGPGIPAGCSNSRGRRQGRLRPTRRTGAVLWPAARTAPVPSRPPSRSTLRHHSADFLTHRFCTRPPGCPNTAAWEPVACAGLAAAGVLVGRIRAREHEYLISAAHRQGSADWCPARVFWDLIAAVPDAEPVIVGGPAEGGWRTRWPGRATPGTGSRWTPSART